MPLRGPRFSGDQILEACLAGSHRMFEPERGIAVKRVQAALIELGEDVGPAGPDGIFGSDTGSAVSRFKAAHGLQPTDPVVGPGTSKALDDDLFVDPPVLDPAFAEFSPLVVDHRVEPFVGLELSAMISTPLDSWRRMTARFALDNLNSGRLTGIVVRTRSEDLRAPYLAVAAPVQPGGATADDFYTRMTSPETALGTTIDFDDQGGGLRSFVLMKDELIMGHETILRLSTGGRAPVTLRDVLLHELNHVRNAAMNPVISAIQDTDPTVYASTSLAQERSAVGPPTVTVLDSFTNEIAARHVQWICVQEDAGNPFAARFLPPEKLLAAVHFYFFDTTIFDRNGYIAGIKAQGQSQVLFQIALWLRVVQQFEFSDDDPENTRTKILFGDTASLAEQLAADPDPRLAEPDGLFPLPNDFVL